MRSKWLVALAVGLPLLAAEGGIRVLVRDPSGAAVGGAEVTVGERSLQSDEEGLAHFRWLAPGHYAINVSSPGFRNWGGTYKVQAEETGDVDAVLRVENLGGLQVVGNVPNAVLRVRVIDPNGRPVPGARLEVWGPDPGGITRETGRDGTVLITGQLFTAGTIIVDAVGFERSKGEYGLNKSNEADAEIRLRLADHVEKVVVRESTGRRFWNWLTSCTR